MTLARLLRWTVLSWALLLFAKTARAEQGTLDPADLAVVRVQSGNPVDLDAIHRKLAASKAAPVRALIQSEVHEGSKGRASVPTLAVTTLTYFAVPKSSVDAFLGIMQHYQPKLVGDRVPVDVVLRPANGEEAVRTAIDVPLSEFDLSRDLKTELVGRWLVERYGDAKTRDLLGMPQLRVSVVTHVPEPFHYRIPETWRDPEKLYRGPVVPGRSASQIAPALWRRIRRGPVGADAKASVKAPAR